MKKSLQSALKPQFLEIRDDSGRHAGHAGARPGGETHYHLVIEAEELKGLSRVAAHQRIHAILAPEFSSGLHALSMEIRR